ncbi:Uncharacterised protein [Legionella pneumophila]|nr:Uncharacterised protein [Legionella pneumophila]
MSIKVQTPTNDSGIVTTGIRTERTEPKNKKITIITMTAASMIVSITSWIDARMNAVASYTIVPVNDGGNSLTIEGNSFLASLITVRGLAVGVGVIDIKTAFLLLKVTELS